MAKETNASKPVMLTIGSVVLISGITMVMVWWQDVLTLFRGFLGAGLAVAGLLIMYTVRD